MPAKEQLNCGALEERLLFSTDTSTEPAEYPWIGILYQVKGKLVQLVKYSFRKSERSQIFLLQSIDNSFENTRCSVVIVGSAHVLTTATCVRRFNSRADLAVVRLGIWNETHTLDEEYICNAKGFCVPGPVQYAVAEIIVHPHADKDTGDNDLAILRLTQSIQWTTYMQPLCLEGLSEPASWIGRSFHFSGFDHSNYLKGKGQALSTSRQYCNRLSGTTKPRPENQFCVYPVKQTRFYEGSALMELNIEKDVPRSFYLVGILVKVVKNGQTTVLVFQDVRPWRSWLKEKTTSAS